MRGFAHGICCLLGHFVYMNNRQVDFVTGGRLFFAGGGNGVYLIGNAQNSFKYLIEGLTRLTGVPCCLIDLFKSVIHGCHAFGSAFLYGTYGIAHIVGGGHGFFGQFANFVGNHGKASPGITGTRSLNGGIKRQQICLVGNIGDNAHDLTDGLGVNIKLQHILLESQRHCLHLTNTDQRFLHYGGPALGFFSGFSRGNRCLTSVAGHLLHGCVHLVHGCCRFCQSLCGLRRALVRLLYLGRKFG